MDEDILLHLT